jgi:hypothetical protein
MRERPLLTGQSLAVVALSVASCVAAACGGSTNSNSPDASGSSSSGSSSSGGGSSGSSSSGSTQLDGGSPDAAASCTPASTAGFTAPKYTNASEHQGVCSATDIGAFIAACGDNGMDSTCNPWIAANVAGEGGAGSACGNCIVTPANSGGAWVDVVAGLNQSGLYPNYAGCLQILDPTNGPACGAAMNAASACESVACDACYGNGNRQGAACDNTIQATGGECASYYNTANSACMADFAMGGANDMCTPGMGNTTDPDWQFILTLICGSASDGGASEGGTTDGAPADGPTDGASSGG